MEGRRIYLRPLFPQECANYLKAAGYVAD